MMRRIVIPAVIVLSLLAVVIPSPVNQPPPILAQDTPSSVADYDLNGNGRIDREEAIAALNDYLVYGIIDVELAGAVIEAYMSGYHRCISLPADPFKRLFFAKEPAVRKRFHGQ